MANMTRAKLNKAWNKIKELVDNAVLRERFITYQPSQNPTDYIQRITAKLNLDSRHMTTLTNQAKRVAGYNAEKTFPHSPNTIAAGIVTLVSERCQGFDLKAENIANAAVITERTLKACLKNIRDVIRTDFLRDDGMLVVKPEPRGQAPVKPELVRPRVTGPGEDEEQRKIQKVRNRLQHTMDMQQRHFEEHRKAITAKRKASLATTASQVLRNDTFHQTSFTWPEEAKKRIRSEQKPTGTVVSQVVVDIDIDDINSLVLL